jgi:galactose mutarotase-like enzyme
MSKKSWILTDVDADVFVDQITLGPEQAGGPARGYSVTKRTLHGGRREGVDVIEVDNGRLRFVVIPTRGMGLWRAECGDVRLGWKSPVKGPVHPSFVPTWEPSGLGWLSGFDELLVRCGLESNGAPEFSPAGALRWPLHGRVANIPAHRVEVSIDGESGEIAVVGAVDETRLFGNKARLTATIRTRVGSRELTVSDEIENLSAGPCELQLLYHTNFGVPLLSPGATIALPVKKMVPRDAVAAADLPQWNVYGPETPGLPEACFFYELSADSAGQTRAVLCAASGERGVSMKFNVKQLPYFTLWKNRMAAADGYVTGLEPALNFPNARSFEKQNGRVVVLSPGEVRRFEVSIEAHTDAAGVAAAQKAVAAIQGGVKPDIWRKFDPTWTPG